MANKLDTEKKLFLGKVPVREATTFGAIRKAVHELDKGEGVSYADLEKHMLENFKPAKSENYNASYVKAYVRDAVNKFDYLSHDDQKNEYSVVEVAAPKPAADKAPKPLTKAQLAKVDVLNVIRTQGDVADESDIDKTQISVGTLVEATKKKTKTIEKMVEELEKEELVRTEKLDDSVYVFLTPVGLKHVNEHAPIVEGDAATTEQPEGTAAKTAGDDATETVTDEA